MIKEITYQAASGKQETLVYMDKGSAYPLGLKAEKFARLMAEGDMTQRAAYCQAYEREIPVTEHDIDNVNTFASRLAHQTQVVLRIRELRAPVIRKLRRKWEYKLDKAFEQADRAYQLADEAGDAKTLLKAVELQSKLGKLLVETVDINHRYGLLDDTATEVLLSMKREFEIRAEKQKKLREIKAVNVETVEGGGV